MNKEKKEKSKDRLNYREQIDGHRGGGRWEDGGRGKKEEWNLTLLSPGICSLRISLIPINLNHYFPAYGFKQLRNQSFPTHLQLCPYSNCLFGISAWVFIKYSLQHPPYLYYLFPWEVLPFPHGQLQYDSPSLPSYVISNQNPIAYTYVLSFIDASQYPDSGYFYMDFGSFLKWFPWLYLHEVPKYMIPNNSKHINFQTENINFHLSIKFKLSSLSVSIPQFSF